MYSLIEVGAGTNWSEETKNAIVNNEPVLLIEYYPPPSDLSIPNCVNWTVSPDLQLNAEADTVVCNHTLEHFLYRENTTPAILFRKMYNMAKLKLVIRVPHYTSLFAFHFSHVSFYNLLSFDGWLSQVSDLQTRDTLKCILKRKIKLEVTPILGRVKLLHRMCEKIINRFINNPYFIESYLTKFFRFQEIEFIFIKSNIKE